MRIVFDCGRGRLHNLRLPRSWASWVLEMSSNHPVERNQAEDDPPTFDITRLTEPVISILRAIWCPDLGAGIFLRLDTTASSDRLLLFS